MTHIKGGLQLNQASTCSLRRSSNKSNSTHNQKGSRFGQALQRTTNSTWKTSEAKQGLHYFHRLLCNVLQEAGRKAWSVPLHISSYVLRLALALSKSFIFVRVWCQLSKDDWFSCRPLDTKTREHAQGHGVFLSIAI